ncbi:MAG: efflux transporter outer membrane subunit [Caulobacteraceae bacterium]
MRSQFALISCAALLAGCINLAPTYRRPVAPIPAVVANSYGATSQPADLAPGAWRTFFGDPKLEDVIAEALANNRDLRIAMANVTIARANYLSQRSQLFPTISANAGANFSGAPAATSRGGTGYVNEHIYSADVGFSGWELDFFGRLRNLSKAAREQYFAAQETQREAQITLVGQVAQAWLTLAADRSSLAVDRRTLAAAQASLRLTSAMYGNGEAALTDVDQAKTLIDQANYAVGHDSVLVRQDEDALGLLVGAPVPETLLPDGIDDEAGVIGALPTGVPSSVLLTRPDVVSAEDQLKAANADIGAARAAFFPQITLTGSGGFISTALSTLFRGASATWSFIPQASLPLFTGGRNRAGLLQAKGERDLAKATYEKTIQTAFRETADALAQKDEIDDELAAQQALVADSADAVRLTTAQYRAGSASYLNVLTAQRTLFSAELSLAATRELASTNLVALYQALGGGL